MMQMAIAALQTKGRTIVASSAVSGSSNSLLGLTHGLRDKLPADPCAIAYHLANYKILRYTGCCMDVCDRVLKLRACVRLL